MTDNQPTIGIKKRIALVAHDNKKKDLLEWARFNRGTLSHHHLFATGNTGNLLEEELELPITQFKSGPIGGDQQIGAKIAEGVVASQQSQLGREFQVLLERRGYSREELQLAYDLDLTKKISVGDSISSDVTVEVLIHIVYTMCVIYLTIRNYTSQPRMKILVS